MMRYKDIPRGELRDAGAVAMRSAGGRSAQRAGVDFEAELEHDNRIYRRQSLALVNRANPPVVTNSLGRPIAFRGKGPCDFSGVLMGVPVLFDAKSRTGARTYSHPPDERHQLEDLKAHDAAGGVAFLLVRDTEESRVYLLGPGYFDDLLVGNPVELRQDRRTHDGLPLVPSHLVSEQDRLVRQVKDLPMWDWARLAITSFPNFGPSAWLTVAK